MATASFFHDRRGIKEDSPSMLRIVIRHKKTSAHIPLDIKLLPNQWDGEQIINHPQARNLNIIINKRMYDVENAMMFLLNCNATFKNATELKDAIVQDVFPNRPKPEAKLKNPFIPIYDRFMTERKAAGTREIYARALDWIRLADPAIDTKSIEDLDKEWVRELDKKMAESNKKNTRSILLRAVRAVFNYAIKEDIIATNPFKGFDLKAEPTAKRSMNVDTLRQIRDTEVAPWQEEYRDMFMLMFYLIGINAGDLFLAKKEQLANGRLEYTRKKTGKHYSILVPPEAMTIIEKYKGKDYLLSPMDRYSNYKDYLQHMNYALTTLGQVYSTSSRKEGEAIFPKLSTYWARHTWATLAYEIGIPIDTIGQALGHSDRAHTITFVYIRLDNKKVDDANRKVLDFLAA